MWTRSPSHPSGGNPCPRSCRKSMKPQELPGNNGDRTLCGDNSRQREGRIRPSIWTNPGPPHLSACPCSDETALTPSATLQRGLGRTDTASAAPPRKGYPATRLFAPRERWRGRTLDETGRHEQAIKAVYRAARTLRGARSRYSCVYGLSRSRRTAAPVLRGRSFPHSRSRSSSG